MQGLPAAGRVICFALSPDATQIAILSRRHQPQLSDTLEVRRIQDGAQLFSRVFPNGTFGQRLRYSADGAFLALLGDTTYIWRTAGFGLLRTITPSRSHSPSVSALSPDGSLVATFSDDATVRFWRVADGAELLVYDDETGPRASVTSAGSPGAASPIQIEFSPSGRQFAFLRGDRTLVVARNPFSAPEQLGDMNGDGCVDEADLLMVLFAFGQTGANAADANNDGTVDDADLLIVLFHFGQGC